jgi:hypothetical protein
MKNRTLRICLSGNMNYPTVYVMRDGLRSGRYSLTGSSFARIQRLITALDSIPDVDLENSLIDYYWPKHEIPV